VRLIGIADARAVVDNTDALVVDFDLDSLRCRAELERIVDQI